MNIIFKNIKIEGFRSVEHIDVDLSNQGVVIVKGINEYEDTASSNGSGKSSIFEAIIFALFEETSSGEKDVENRVLNKGYNIELDFGIDDKTYKIIRKSSGSKSEVSLFEDDKDISARTKTDTNKLIISKLGITKDIFLDSILLSQNVSTNLTSLSPTARKERLELLTSTNEIIENFKEKLKTKQLQYEQLVVDAQLNINKLEGKNDVLNQQISQNQARILNTKREIEQKKSLGSIEEIEKSISENNDKIVDFNKDIEQLDIQIQQILKDWDEVNKKELEFNEQISNIDLQVQQLREEFNKLDREEENYKTDAAHKRQEITKLVGEISVIKNSDTCPTCGRKYDNVNEEHILSTIELKNKDINTLENQIKEIESKYPEIRSKKSEKEQSIVKLQNEDAEIKNKKNEFNKQTSEISTRLNALKGDKDNDYQEIKSLQSLNSQLEIKKQQLDTSSLLQKIEEYKQVIEESNKQCNEIKLDIERYNKQNKTNSEYVEVCKNASQLITKDFRTYLLQNSIKFLNTLLQEYSRELFSNEKDVIKVEDDSSKLNITLGKATYESLSGGEKTRVDIALLLAQKSLASTIGNISSNIIILDEVLKFCDSTTEMKIIDLIIKELDTLESIYMISHKEIPIGYDRQLVVLKNKDGLSNLI